MSGGPRVTETHLNEEPPVALPKRLRVGEGLILLHLKDNNLHVNPADRFLQNWIVKVDCPLQFES